MTAGDTRGLPFSLNNELWDLDFRLTAPMVPHLKRVGVGLAFIFSGFVLGERDGQTTGSTGRRYASKFVFQALETVHHRILRLHHFAHRGLCRFGLKLCTCHSLINLQITDHIFDIGKLAFVLLNGIFEYTHRNCRGFHFNQTVFYLFEFRHLNMPLVAS